MEGNKKKNTDDININVSDDINVTDSEISISVNSKDGQQKTYDFPEALPSNVIALQSVASTAADMGIQVLQPWQDKITNEIDDIKNFQMEEVEINFGLVKFKFKRKPKD
jgi:hypothetical protein